MTDPQGTSLSDVVDAINRLTAAVEAMHRDVLYQQEQQTDALRVIEGESHYK